MKLSLNQKLASLAFILAIGTSVMSFISPEKKSISSQHGVQFISVVELATNIKNKDDITLLDLRGSHNFQQFHIPTAISFQIDEYSLEFDESRSIILYSDNDSLSHKAYKILSGNGTINVFVLQGGIQDWYDRILYPQIPKILTESEQELASQIKSLSAYFGGRSVFVDDEHTLDYYRGTIKETVKTPVSQLVRMGC